MIREEEAGALIASWEERLQRVDENLIALEAEPTYQMLAGGARARLTGDTAARVVPALDALGELFEHRERLNGVVTRAKELQAELSFWNKDDKLAAIAELLSGRSITLGARQMPVAQRNLLDSAATDLVVAPAELLGEMVRGYQIARDAVAEVAAAWARLEPALAQLEEGVAEVERSARELGKSDAVQADLGAVVAELTRVRALVSTDPLGVAGAVDAALAPRVGALRSELAELLAHKASVARRLAATGALLAKIDEAAQSGALALERATREIVPTGDVDPGVVARREVAAGLPAWRDKIASVAAAGRWKAADVGLARWMDAATGVLEGELDVARKVAAAEERRTELRGRLSARRAQASSLAARGLSAPASLDGLAATADALLRKRPTDLAQAGDAVDAYETALRALGGKHV